jgi:hypothetical protein
MMMKNFKSPFCCSKFPWARERISPKIIENLGTRSKKVSLALPIFPSFSDVAEAQIYSASTVPTSLHGVTTQNIVVVFTAVGTSNLTQKPSFKATGFQEEIRTRDLANMKEER